MRTSIAVLILSFLPISACLTRPEQTLKECEGVCDKLKTCKLIPSALGSGADIDEAKRNCTARCALTSDAKIHETNECLSKVDPDLNDTDLCSAKGDSPCIEARDCIMSLYSEEIPVVGKGDAAVKFVRGYAADSSAEKCGCSKDSKGASETTCFGSVLGRYRDTDGLLYGSFSDNCDVSDCGELTDLVNDDYCTVNGSKALCSETQMTGISLFVLESGLPIRQSAKAACVETLSGETRVENLLPGYVQIGAKIRGGGHGKCNRNMVCNRTDQAVVPPDTGGDPCGLETDFDDTDSAIVDALSADEGDTESDVDAASWCVVIYGRPVVVAAGSTVDTVIPIPDVHFFTGLPASEADYYRCEETPSLCTDGIDNDGDGAVDCEDDDCAGFCIEDSSAQCLDGIDNDADGMTDCDDPHCVELSACGAADTSSGSGRKDAGAEPTAPSIDETD